MEPWTGNAESGAADVIVAILILFVVIGLIIFAAKMIFRGDAPGEIILEDEEKEDD